MFSFSYSSRLLFLSIIILPAFFAPNQFSAPASVEALVSGTPLPSGFNDWIINQNTTAVDEVIVLNGSIVINSPYNLTLRNVTVQFNCTYDGEYNITVRGGGALFMENCTVTTLNASNAWFLQAEFGSAILLNDSTFNYAGYNYLSAPIGARFGLYINSRDAQVLNCTIYKNYVGLYLSQAEDCLLANNTIMSSLSSGITLYESSTNNVSNNELTNCSHGINLAISEQNVIMNNTIINCPLGDGIFLFNSSDNIMEGNNVTNPKWGIDLNISNNNTICNNSLALTNSTMDGIHIYASANNNVSGNFIIRNAAYSGRYAIDLEQSGNCTVNNNTITNCSSNGIYLLNSGNSTVNHNTIANCSNSAIRLTSSDNSTVNSNDISSASVGINMWFMDNCTVSDNHIANVSSGIILEDATNNTVSRSTISNANYGIDVRKTSNCTLAGNTITNSSEIGINLWWRTGDCFVWGNFLAGNRRYNAYDENSTNRWDNGTHGNYYDDYFGPDLNNDGIGDIPYSISGPGGAQDRYPLVNLTDTSPPSIDSPGDLTFQAGTPLEQFLNWHPNDPNPYWYNITVNEGVVVDDIWDGSPISYDVSSLSTGTYTCVLTVFDRSGNFASDEVLVTVTPPADTDPPTIGSPGNIYMTTGTTGRQIIWYPRDDHPSRYELYKDGDLIEEGPWTGEYISFSLDGLPAGHYEFTLIVYDIGELSASDIVWVFVKDPTESAAPSDSKERSAIAPGFGFFVTGLSSAVAILTNRRKRKE
ncbi:MAG: right-handed parallel beta-helix repeat-containing protein [Candidatus Thorarchaeota archaeon]